MITGEELLDFGPYTPYMSIPYFLIYGEGLPELQPFYITAKRNFEVIVTPEISHLANYEE